MLRSPDRSRRTPEGQGRSIMVANKSAITDVYRDQDGMHHQYHRYPFLALSLSKQSHTKPTIERGMCMYKQQFFFVSVPLIAALSNTHCSPSSVVEIIERKSAHMHRVFLYGSISWNRSLVCFLLPEAAGSEWCTFSIFIMEVLHTMQPGAFCIFQPNGVGV